MQRRTWYLVMLFLPLLFPVATFLLAWISGYEALILAIGMVLRFLIICSLIGGIPYFFFALGVLWWWRKKTADQIKKASWWLPWIFTPLCSLFFLVVFMVEKPEGSAVLAALTLAAFCVPVGFIYVFAVHLLTKLAMATKLVRN